MPIDSGLGVVLCVCLFHLQRVEAENALTVESTWMEEEHFGLLLEDLLYDKKGPSIAALNALVLRLHQLGWPVGLIEGVFLKLYQEEIVDDAHFIDWKDDTELLATKEGQMAKQKALIKTNAWFDWLAEQQAAEEDEEESEEEESDEEDD